MYYPYQPPSLAHGPSPSSRPSKVIQQREYREKEVECFKTLRGVIRDLTGQEPRTREDILRKAIDMLITALETRKQSETQWEVNGTLSPSAIMLLADHMTSVHMDYASQCPQPSNWHPSAEPVALSYHDHTLAYDQQCHTMSSSASPSVGYGEGFFNY